jgi:hypothetical protein
LVVIDAKTGAILFTRNFDGYNKSDDEPASIVYDSFNKAYMIAGTSTIKSIIGTQTQIMLVRTANTGALVYTRLIGYFGIQHTSVAATLIPNGFNSQVEIAGVVTGVLNGIFYNKQVSYTSVDIATGNSAMVHVIRKNFDPRGIAFIASSSSLNIVGNRSFLGTESNLFNVDPTDPSMLGTIHVYNHPFSTFAFNGINTGTPDQLVMVGSHLFPLPWAGSPADLNYHWLTTADSYGNGECDNSDTLSAFAFPVPVMANNASSVSFTKNGVTVEEITQSEVAIDGCDIPFRLTNTATPATAEFRLYPNPSTTSVTVEYTVADNDNADLTLLDMSGRVILTQKLVSGDHATTTLNVAELASGLYYSDLRVNGLSVKKDKLVVQH